MVKTAVENGQNLIVEGCYIPPEWRADFSGDYLRSIDFVCLAMSDAYIDAHYEEIISHGSDIEDRLDDSGCTRDSLKEDNRCCIDSFAERGERVAVIQSDFEEETGALLREFEPCRTPSAIGRSRNRPSATRGTVIGDARNGYRRITEQLSVKRVVSTHLPARSFEKGIASNRITAKTVVECTQSR